MWSAPSRNLWRAPRARMGPDERGVRAPRHPRRQRLDAGEGPPARSVRVGPSTRHGDDGPHPRAGPGRHADRRLRALWDPFGSWGPDRAPGSGNPARSLMETGLAYLPSHPELARRIPLRVRVARGLSLGGRGRLEPRL